MDIITKEYQGTKKIYYHVDKFGKTKKIENFTSDNINIYKLDTLVDSDIKNGKIINRAENPRWKDPDENSIDDTEILDRILEQTLKVEHSICSVKILEDQQEYFVVYNLNVNWQNPFELCHYNQEKDELEYVAQFENADVVGLRSVKNILN
jgi:hypothetical protein